MSNWRVLLGLVGILLLAAASTTDAAPLVLDTPNPPDAPVRLVFIHHSTGGNWLADPNSDQPYGGLGRALMDNNYYVSATNYGWGPEGIGDRTDIPNWPEWFLGPNRDVILDALYSERDQNVGDFGDWSRLERAPEGENQIVMFKSCFPNSNLEGNPDDPPLAAPNDWDYSVSNAKAVYIALLDYFRTRPDKLFVVITAPPLMRGETSMELASNARAFNTWLVHDWLREYPYSNVAVFDYYNVLTGPDHHHRWNGNEIEHVQGAPSDFAAYPSGDSHPSTDGHRKATAEFMPLLNIWYHRWQSAGVALVPTAAAPISSDPVDDEVETGGITSTGGILEDFESEFAWHVDVGQGARVECGTSGDAYAGASALHLTYAIPAEGWGGCWRYFDSAQDWSAHRGISFWLRGDTSEHWVTFTLFTGNPDAPTPYEARIGPTSGWESVVLSWDDLTLAPWADDRSAAVPDVERVISLGFSPDAGEGALSVDDLILFDDSMAVGTPEVQDSVPGPAPEATEPAAGPFSGICAAMPLILAMVTVGLVIRRRDLLA